MSEIVALHKEVFEYLMEKRKEYPDLYFTLNTDTMTLREGFLFGIHNNSQIKFSFWYVRKPNVEDVIYFVIKDSELYLEIPNSSVFGNFIELEKSLKYSLTRIGGGQSYGIYKKSYGKDWKKGFDFFLENDKIIIDLYLKDVKNEKLTPIDKDIFDYWLNQLSHFGFYNPNDKSPKNFQLNPNLRLDKISLKNITHFEEIDLDVSKNVTILIGENGCGKTTILRALALAITGLNAFDLDKDFKKEKDKIIHQLLKIETYKDAIPVYASEGKIGLSLKDLDKNIDLELVFEPSGLVEGKVEAQETDTESRQAILGENKFLRQTIIGFAQSQKKISETFVNKRNNKPVVTDLFPLISGTSEDVSNDLVEWIYYYVHEAQNTQPIDDLFALFSKIIQKEISLKKPYEIGAVGSPKGEKTIIVCTPESPNGINLGLVSQGYQNIFYWLGGIVMKLSAVQTEYYREEKINQIPAIVLIDEIDTYLHPKWQANILKVLVEEFPKIQFVVTTHSELVLSGFEKENIYHISKEGVLQPYSNTLGMDSSSILRMTNSVFREPKTQKLIDEIEVLIEENDLENAQSKLSELKNINPKILEIRQFESLIRLKNNSENATHSQK